MVFFKKIIRLVNAVADPRGRPRHAPPGMRPPTDQNIHNFMQFFGKTWQICMLAPPTGGLAPPPRRILDPPLKWTLKQKIAKNFSAISGII